MSNPSEGIFKKIIERIMGFFRSESFKFILFLLVIGALCLSIGFFVEWIDEKSHPHGEYEMTYRVYYTENNVKEYTITHNRPIYMRSSKGSNEIHKHGWGDVIETSAPIEVVRYVNKAK